MRAGDQKYDWVDDWAGGPDPDGGWAHHGVVVLRSGEVVSFHAGEPTLLLFGPDGGLRRPIATSLTEAHGMTLVEDDGAEFLWVADCGVKLVPADASANGYEMRSGGGQVVKLTLDGETVLRLPMPPGFDDPYAPTWVAVDEARFGGSGDVWVADGYGQSVLHRFTAEGQYVATYDGTAGGHGHFNCPHALFIDRRGPEPRLLVADRGNAQVVVLDLEGSRLGQFGQGWMLSPSVFATFGPYLVIGELNARLTVCDADDELVAYLGANEEVCSVPGWPNQLDADGRLVRSSLLVPGKFNSPHGMAVDADGSIYVAEWLIGGRFTKLARH
jgi:DNA-binding beta-propeller fold protein YncE